MSTRNLDYLFNPQSIAVIGEVHQPENPGGIVIRNLLASDFAGPVMPVNPARRSVNGVLCYPGVAELPLAPDLAILCAPARRIPALIAELGQRGTRAVIVRAGRLRREQDSAGKSLQQAMLEAARPYLLRVLGPNSLGLVVPRAGLNAGFMPLPALPGRVALVHESEALCTAMLDWARSNELGFSHFISLGDSADIDLGDVLDYLGGSAEARAILLHIHSIPHARKFMSAARAVARHKPVLVVKTGRVAASARMIGDDPVSDDAVFDAAIRRAGLLRVFTTDELFAAVATLANAAPTPGDRLAIITNGTGPGVLATDDLILGEGHLAELSAATLAKLAALVPGQDFRGNPVDILDDADAPVYAKALEIVLHDARVDAVLVLHAPHAGLSSELAAQAAIEVAKIARKTVLTSWLGGNAVAAARQRFAQAGVPTYDTPDQAVRAFLHLVRFRRNQTLLIETPPSLPTAFSPQPARARTVIEQALSDGRRMLDEAETREVLAAYGLSMVATRVVTDADEAVRAAREIGFPVAVKIVSPAITDRSAVGGVMLYQETPEAVREAIGVLRNRSRSFRPDAPLAGFAIQPMVYRPPAYELQLQVKTDPAFGPVILFGQGGPTGRALPDSAVGLPPLNLHLARELMARTRIVHALRASPLARDDTWLNTIELALVRVSQMILDIPELVALSIDPLLADSHGVVALDASIGLQPTAAIRPRRLAIRPYPKELEEAATLRDGQPILLRPIRPEDEERYQDLHRHLTQEDLFLRFFLNTRGDLPRVQVARLIQIDYDREMAFVATVTDGDNQEILWGAVHTSTDPNNITAEYSIAVRSDTQGRGLGHVLMSKMIAYCRARGTRKIMGYVLPDNVGMLRLCDRLGFSRHFDAEEDVFKMRLPLQT